MSSASDELDITVPSGRLHVERFGSASAPLVVGLPGLSGNSQHLRYLAERIGGDERGFVAVDYRGRGRSEHTAPGTYGWENHARDILALTDALGAETFAVVGLSMGASVAMRIAELAPVRLHAVALVDVAGRVDPGVGPVIAATIDRLADVPESVDAHVDAVRAAGLVPDWDEYWDRAHRYEIETAPNGLRRRTSAAAVAEDRAYTATQDPYRRWVHLTMPTLLVRATRELQPGSGHVVPADDLDRFRREVPSAVTVEVDGNHLTVTTHPDTAAALRRFLTTIG